MSTHVENKVKCDCGHEGIIHLHESDAINSWESYSLENLNGVSFESNTPVNMIEVLKEMNVSCPSCGKKIEKKIYHGYNG